MTIYTGGRNVLVSESKSRMGICKNSAQNLKIGQEVDFLVFQPEMKSCCSHCDEIGFYYKLKKQKSCLRLRKDVICVSIDISSFVDRSN